MSAFLMDPATAKAVAAMRLSDDMAAARGRALARAARRARRDARRSARSAHAR
jgi:hypothetical protein